MSDLDDVDIECLGLSARVENALLRPWGGRFEPITTVSKLCEFTGRELAGRRPGIGPAAVREIQAALAARGRRLAEPTVHPGSCPACGGSGRAATP